jgi:protein-S-isoprenylcysteine O-methyltransferase Ste14
MTRAVVFGAYAVLGAAFAAMLFRAGVRNILGRPTIPPRIYYPGKLALFGAMSAPLLQAAGLQVAWTAVPRWLEWTSLGLLLAGVAATTAALLALGGQTRMGLGNGTRTLQTGGPYRYSRNPMYAGALVMSAAGFLGTLNPLCLAASIFAAAVHHFIVRAEERFLKDRFGEAWDRYAARVRRYL